MMKSVTIKLLKWIALIIGAGVIVLLGMRAWDAERSPPLSIWHTYTPDDLRAGELGKLEWSDYLKAENALFDDVRENVTRKLEPEDRVPANRYYEGSPIYPGSFTTDWNRSYILEPDSATVGAVVLLHGLTDHLHNLLDALRAETS